MMLRKTNNLPLSRVSEEEAGGAKRSPKIMGLLRASPHPLRVLAIHVWLF